MNAFQVRNYRIPVNKKSRGEATIVLLCDLHGACYGENHRELIDAIDAQRPDLIVSAGDLIMDADRPRIDNVLALLHSLPPGIRYTAGTATMRRNCAKEKEAAFTGSWPRASAPAGRIC